MGSVTKFVALSGFISWAVGASQIKVVTEYLPPFQVKNNDGSLGGYATEVVDAMFALTGDDADVQVLPWSRGYRIALKEPNVLIYSIARTTPREPLFQWVAKLKDERIYVWGLKSKFSAPFCTLSEFKDLTFASSKDYHTESFFLNHKFKYIQRLNQNEQTIGMLFKERADLVVGNDLIFQYQAQILGLDFSQMIKLYEAKSLNSSLSIAFSLTSDVAVVNRFKQAFALLEVSGKLTLIKRKWHVQDDALDERLSPYPQVSPVCPPLPPS
jgi:polar amino acid transport system substrate-binding protein